MLNMDMSNATLVIGEIHRQASVNSGKEHWRIAVTRGIKHLACEGDCIGWERGLHNPQVSSAGKYNRGMSEDSP
jgi:hypothetical protein